MSYSTVLTLAIGCILFAATTSCTHAVAGKHPLKSQDVQEGVSLYEEYCAKCHQPFTSTTKSLRPINRIRSSIAQVPAMHNLDFLNEKQLEDITSALATISL